MSLTAGTMGLGRHHCGSVGAGSVRQRSAVQLLVTSSHSELVCCFFSLRTL